jgi:hypothetical protein
VEPWAVALLRDWAATDEALRLEREVLLIFRAVGDEPGAVLFGLLGRVFGERKQIWQLDAVAALSGLPSTFGPRHGKLRLLAREQVGQLGRLAFGCVLLESDFEEAVLVLGFGGIAPGSRLGRRGWLCVLLRKDGLLNAGLQGDLSGRSV